MSSPAALDLAAELRRMGCCRPCVHRFEARPAADVAAYVSAAAEEVAEEAEDTRGSARERRRCCPTCLGILQVDPDLREGGVGAGAGAEGEARAGGSCGNAPSSSNGGAFHESVRTRRAYVDGIRSGGHLTSTFALEVTLPPSIVARHAACRAHLWDVGIGVEAADRATPVKDVLRALVIDALEASPCSSGGSETEGTRGSWRHDQDADFRFALLFEHELSASEAAFAFDAAGEGRDRGRDSGDGNNRRFHKKRPPPAHLGYNLPVIPESPAGLWQQHGAVYKQAERIASTALRSSAAIRSAGDRTSVAVPPTAPATAATCRMLTWHQPMYVGGHYLKWARGVPQSPWVADGETVGEGSVQTSLDAVIVRRLRADASKLNSAGREDMDVRMLGGGRPFILEVHNPRAPPPSRDDFLEMEAALEAADDGVVTARGLHVTDHASYYKMHEGSAEKQKVYTAVCWASKRLTAEDMASLSEVKELVVQQATPVRVLHRRSPATRPRTVHSMSAELVPGAPHFFVLRLKTQAGTYIKEFVHGDFGRTRPSVGELLGCAADIMQLDVTEIDMDFGREPEVQAATGDGKTDGRHGKAARTE